MRVGFERRSSLGILLGNGLRRVGIQNRAGHFTPGSHVIACLIQIGRGVFFGGRHGPLEIGQRHGVAGVADRFQAGLKLGSRDPDEDGVGHEKQNNQNPQDERSDLENLL